MKLDELQNQINEYLIKREVKKPQIRMRAFRNIREFIEKSGSFIMNEEVDLHVERPVFASQYSLHKKNNGKSENLSGAETHVIKLIYDYCDNKN